jgi:hemin uptake protein HemP
LDTSAAQSKGPQDPAGEAGPAGPSNLPKIITFSSLVRCGDEVWIEHSGNLYRLRRTKQDKLILTK